MVPRSSVQVLGSAPFHDTGLTASGELSYIGGNWERDVAFAGYSVPLQVRSLCSSCSHLGSPSKSLNPTEALLRSICLKLGAQRVSDAVKAAHHSRRLARLSAAQELFGVSRAHSWQQRCLWRGWLAALKLFVLGAGRLSRLAHDQQRARRGPSAAAGAHRGPGREPRLAHAHGVRRAAPARATVPGPAAALQVGLHCCETCLTACKHLPVLPFS